MNVFTIGMSARASDGGLERYFFELFDALASAGESPRGLVVGTPDGSCDAAPAVASFARANEPMLRRWSAMRKVAPRYLRDADVAVSHFAANAFPIANALGKCPFVVHFHGPWALESRAEGGSRAKAFVRHHIERRVYARADRLIVLSAAFGAILETSYGVAPERIAIVRGGVNLRRFATLAPRRDARERLGWPAGRPVVTTARRLVPSKGVESLIDAAAIVRERIPDVLVQILGTGPLRADLERRVAERGLERHVRLAGRVSDEALALAYRASDLFVVPSLALEGFGLVVIEALASGTPAMVTNVGGLPETVRDLSRALVFDDKSPGAIARGIVAALDGSLALPSEDACVAHARTFDWHAVAADVATIYRDALAARA